MPLKILTREGAVRDVRSALVTPDEPLTLPVCVEENTSWFQGERATEGYLAKVCLCLIEYELYRLKNLEAPRYS